MARQCFKGRRKLIFRLYKPLLFIFLCITLPIKVNATDINNFDIANVKLGMTYLEAITTIKKFMDIGDEDILLGFSKINPISNKPEPGNVVINLANINIGISFTPNALDMDSPISVVTFINYKVLQAKDAKTMEEAVLTKYSTPSFIKRGWMVWCENLPNKIKTCIDHTQFRYSYTTLEASTQKYNRALQKHLESKQEEQVIKF